jgi:hypothetical protein
LIKKYIELTDCTPLINVIIATWGHNTCTNIRKNMTKLTWDYNWKIQKCSNTIYMGTLAINDKTISMRTIKTLFRKKPQVYL